MMAMSDLALKAKRVIESAWLHGTAYDLASQAAFALESAQLLQSPETAAEHEQALDDLTGANLARWEEEQDNARLRLALASAQRGRRELRAQVAELLAERRVTNEALDDAVQGLRTSFAERSADKLTQLLAPTQALQLEGEHYAAVHHAYRVPRDLPPLGGAPC